MDGVLGTVTDLARCLWAPRAGQQEPSGACVCVSLWNGSELAFQEQMPTKYSVPSSHPLLSSFLLIFFSRQNLCRVKNQTASKNIGQKLSLPPHPALWLNWQRICLQCGRPGLGRSPREGKGYLLQYSGLENSMDCIESDTTEQLSLSLSPNPDSLPHPVSFPRGRAHFFPRYVMSYKKIHKVI